MDDFSHLVLREAFFDGGTWSIHAHKRAALAFHTSFFTLSVTDPSRTVFTDRALAAQAGYANFFCVRRAGHSGFGAKVFRVSVENAIRIRFRAGPGDEIRLSEKRR